MGLAVDCHRPDKKTARDFNISTGAVLDLILALRGGTPQ
jgi:hypothetical protein